MREINRPNYKSTDLIEKELCTLNEHGQSASDIELHLTHNLYCGEKATAYLKVHALLH
jgi:hypothetical protein